MGPLARLIAEWRTVNARIDPCFSVVVLLAEERVDKTSASWLRVSCEQ